MGHTPGPWTVYEDNFGEILIEYKDGVVVDRVGTLVSNDERDNEILRADARLIAAAPLLLAFAQTFVACYGQDRHLQTDVFVSFVEQAEQAISAATTD